MGLLSWLFEDGKHPKLRKVLKHDIFVVRSMDGCIHQLSREVLPSLRPNLRKRLQKALEELVSIRDKHIQSMGLKDYPSYLSFGQTKGEKENIVVVG